MAPRRIRRNGWHQVNGKWTRSLGERGCRVRLFQKRRTGVFYREVWIAGEGSDRKSLHTGNRDVAERLGKELLANLMRGEEIEVTGTLTLGQLWERYRTECSAHLDNKRRTQQDYVSRASVLIGFFGEHCDVRSLGERDQAAFVRKRLAGGIRRQEGDKTGVVTNRSVEADLAFLHSMFKWATTVRLPTGQRLLDRNPLEGIRRPREKNPRRPVATWERFQATRSAMAELASSSATDAERRRWVKMELALVLAEATGRRLGSIRQLRWEDVDLQHEQIRWRAEADKKGRESVVPIPTELAEELRVFRRRLGAVGGWVFSGERLPDQPMDRHLFDRWLTVAEQKAKLPKLNRGLWHPYRRKWATERKHLSLKDVAEAGGWKDTETLLTCYQQPDRESLLAVMSEPWKVRDASVSR